MNGYYLTALFVGILTGVGVMTLLGVWAVTLGRMEKK